jgi:hypothetical protein
MSTTLPEAETEYSKGSGASLTHSAILAGTLLAAVLLLVAEFTRLFDVSAGGATIKTVATGSHHGYALVPVALLAALLGFAVQHGGSRPALLAIGVLGVIALLIAVLGDLPDAHVTGLVFRGGHYESAASSPSVGLYMETLGAIVLLITSVCGFLILGPPARDERRRPPRMRRREA